MHHDIVFMVLEDILMLLFIYIQPDSEELVLADPAHQVIRIDQAAAGRVDQDYTVFHLVDGVDVDHVVRLFNERAMQGDQVALRKKLIQAHVLNEIKILVRIHVIAKHPHAVAFADTGHGGADLAGSDDAGSLPVEVYADKPLEREIVLPNADIGLVQVAADGAGKCHRVLCDSLRRITGYVHDRDAAFGCGLQVHIVVACAAHQKKLHAAALQLAHGHGTGLCIDERAHGLAVLHVRCGPRVQLRGPVFQFQIRILTDERVKGLPVITLGVKKCDLHYISSFTSFSVRMPQTGSPAGRTEHPRLPARSLRQTDRRAWAGSRSSE